MELYEAIVTRRSIRKFAKNAQISKEDVLFCVNAAMYAPSARNYRSWQFYLSCDRTFLLKLSEIHPYGKMLAEASWAVLVCNDDEIEPEDGYAAINCAVAVQNFLLSAHDKGFGAVWLGVYPRIERVKDMRAVFNCPAHHSPMSLIALGVPAEIPVQPVRVEPDKIHFL